MKVPRVLCIAAAGALAATGAHAAVVDVVQAPTGFFAPNEVDAFTSPYYRSFGEDWDWSHGSITEPWSSANLQISAFDVDYDPGERDEIFAYDNGNPVSIGFLQGSDSSWSYSNFSLGENFRDDLASGLRVSMAIDTTNAGWLVTLAKSVITTDGATPPPPEPGVVPIPPALPLLMAGLGALGFVSRRSRQRV